LDNNYLYSQQELIDSLNKGDMKAFNQLFKELYAPLLYYCRHIVQDEEEAKDIVSASFQKCWEHREAFKNYLNAKSFLYLVVRNASFDYLKRKSYKITQYKNFSLPADLVEQDTDYLEMEAEILQRIIQEVGQLPEKCRKVFELSFLQGKTISEVAELLQMSASNVTSQRSRALQLLRIALANYPLAMLYFIVHFRQH
jgi:RNA polymerase sigma-70 factor (ECF subfamily)